METSRVSEAVRPLHAAVADWQRYCEDDSDHRHLSQVLNLANALVACGTHLDLEGDVNILSVVGNLVEACMQTARELDEPIPEKETP